MFHFVPWQGSCCINRLVSGRWGEVEIEKGPVDLFPTEPTDEATPWRGDLEPWVQGTPRHVKTKKTQTITRLSLFVFNAEDGT